MIKTAFKFAKGSIVVSLIFFSIFLVSMSKSSILCAAAVATIADSPCDTLYYDSLSSRAWLEAQREITQNQNFILKPDSVFQYTCFDRFLRELADHSANMLSETSAFGGPLGSTSMDSALNNLVIPPLQQYLSQNFNSSLALSGHSAALSIPNHTVSSISAPMTYSCDIMLRVWNAARCTNFISYPQYDGFYTFQEYTTSLDPRHLPSACDATFPSATVNVRAAYVANIAMALSSGPWSNDPVQTYNNIIGTPTFSASGTCTGSCACSGAPVPTGVRVSRPGTAPSSPGNTYDEHVCLQAGCRYHPGGILYGTTTATAGCYAR